MLFNVLSVSGDDAVRLLEEHRSRYPSTGLYPFLIGDAEELGRIEETGQFDSRDPAAIIQNSCELDIARSTAERREEAEEDDRLFAGLEGEWPGEVDEKGSISLHLDMHSGKVKQEVHLGLAKIEQPWHLPAVLKYGAWNDCPCPELHCAFYRQWQERYGAEIIGMSGDVIECTVRKPPTDREAAMSLAWEQYCYCPDIVEQGCGSIANLAATLLNSNYWFFWWD